MAISGSSLWVTDALGNRVLEYNLSTGKQVASFTVSLPTAIAVDSSGQVWVGYNHVDVGVFSPTGASEGTFLSTFTNIVSLAFGPTGLLSVADSGKATISTYDAAHGNKTPLAVLGQPAVSGDVGPSDFFKLQGIAVDSLGNLITTQVMPGKGAELAKFSPSGQPVWTQYGNENSDSGTLDPSNPSMLYTATFHVYQLGTPSTGQSTFAGDSSNGQTSYVNSADSGTMRIISLGTNSFMFIPQASGLVVYRINGSASQLAALVGGTSFLPPGYSSSSGGDFWSWDDSVGTGTPLASQVHFYSGANLTASVVSTHTMSVDGQGNLWFASISTGAIYELPMGPLDVQGNPTYNWNNLKIVVQPDASSLGFTPQMVTIGDDGSIYALGDGAEFHTTPGIFWMGGNEIAKYTQAGALDWVMKLPETSTAIVAIPGGQGGVIAGGAVNSVLYQVTSDGMVIGLAAPGVATDQTAGSFDNNGSINLARNPVDGTLEVFTEDVWNDRLGWYQINDTQFTTINGSVKRP